VLFGLFVKMSNGATFAVVPFINRRAMGAVAGIVGAGGNAGAVLAGFLLKAEGLNWHSALFLLGALVTTCSFLSFAVTVRPGAETVYDTMPRNRIAIGAPEPAGTVT
jgi:NNP family nitrate/nitrite transporter-like MFS transporter